MLLPDHPFRIKIDSLEYGSTFLSGYFGTDEKADKSGTKNLKDEQRRLNKKIAFLYISYNNPDEYF